MLQRVRYRVGELTPEHVARLEALPGWTWNVNEFEWERSFAYLMAFVKVNGTSEVHSSFVEGDFELGKWVCQQRYDYRNGIMRADRIVRFEAIESWSWGVSLNDHFEKGLDALRSFVEREGTTRIPEGHLENGFNLHPWAAYMRSQFVAGRLSPERISQFDHIEGWFWSLLDERWEAMFGVLESYVAREGHSCVPVGHLEGDVHLGLWVVNQRKSGRKAGKMAPERRERFDALPWWSWNGHEAKRIRPRVVVTKGKPDTTKESALPPAT